MATITFSPKVEDTATAVMEVPSLEVAVVEAAPLAVVDSPSQSKVRREDVLLPRVNLVQKSGKLCDEYPPGSFLFEKQVVLAKPGDSFDAVALSFITYFQEKVEYGSSEFGKRANSEEEVRQQGGSTVWGVTDRPYYQPVADVLMAVKAPKGAGDEITSLFPFTYEGEHYAVAVYTVASSAYTSLAKRIITDSIVSLKAGLHLGVYSIKSEIKRNAQNSWYIPVAGLPKKYNDPAKEAFFAELKAI